MAPTGVGAPDVLLGVDPGLAATGWALVDGDSRVARHGTIRTRPGLLGPRLLQIVNELRQVLAAHPVTEAALEELFMGRNATSALAVAQARGAVMAALAAADVTVFEYKPAQVKSVLTGYGMADKSQMGRMLALQVGVEGHLDEHAADAVAIAVCHVRSRRLRQVGA